MATARRTATSSIVSGGILPNGFKFVSHSAAKAVIIYVIRQKYFLTGSEGGVKKLR